MKRKIAILFHEKARTDPLNYLINVYAGFWREDGHEVIPLFGEQEFVPADLIIVHVDLSVVPDEYLEFARRYPIVLNGEIKDIRKSTYSSLRIQPGSDYDGKVIVKSNYNYAGVPERHFGVTLDSSGISASFFGSTLDYQIYDSPSLVPAMLLEDPNTLVEKFMPEMDNGLYCVRALLFLGERFSCTKVSSRNPIVNGTTQDQTEFVEPHPDILQLRKTMKFDYGKFDYVEHSGRAILLDANKTVGAATFPSTPQRVADRRRRAEGLYSWF